MKFILFDIEATCWNGYHSNGVQEIIELGAIAINLYGEENDRFVSFVRPVINPHLSQYCTDLTGITQRDIDSARAFGEIYSEFEDWAMADPDTWFVSWGDFDPIILTEECERCFQATSLIGNHLDLQREYTRLKNLSPRTSLMKALEHEEWIFDGEPHRALPDTRNMGLIFKEYFEYWGFG